VTNQIQDMTGIETRNTVLGHIQRGGAPTGYDRVLATRFGMNAIDLVAEGRFGQMVALDGTEIVRVDLAAALDGLKTVPQHRFDEAKVLFGR
jgi:6-phosphofructokinase 1